MSLDAAISCAEQMILDGVDIIDIGGESTRPGAKVVSLDEELRRVMPLIYALRDCGKPLSVDTYKPEVMAEAILAGADMINDIKGFSSMEAKNAVAASEVGLCVMHMQNTPADMQLDPQYRDVNEDVLHFMHKRMSELQLAGIAKERLCFDPGFGFGKTLEHNVTMMKNLQLYQRELGLPSLVGISRKNMIGAITGKPVEQRMAGSLAAALAAMNQGARILRVHDVAETVDAIKVWQRLSN